MASGIPKDQWKFHYAVAGFVDLLQIVLDGFGPIGIGINALMDPIIGALLILYFWFRDFNILTHPKILLSLLCVAGVEELTGGIAPAWIADIWYIQKTIVSEQGEAEPEIPKGVTLPRGRREPPLNSKPGVRLPRSPSRL